MNLEAFAVGPHGPGSGMQPATKPLCPLLISGYDVSPSGVSEIWNAVDERSHTMMFTEQCVFGDLSKEAMKPWVRQARNLRLKLVQTLSAFERESDAVAIYTHIVMRAYELVSSPMIQALALSVPDINSGACSIFTSLCERMSERGIMIFAVGELPRESVPKDLLWSVYDYICVSSDPEKPPIPSSAVSHSTNGATTTTASRPSLFAGSDNTASVITAPSTVPGWMGVSTPTPIGSGAGRVKSPPTELGFARAVGAPAPDTDSERTHTASVAAPSPEHIQRNLAALAAHLTKKLRARGGPPYASLQEVITMAEEMPHPVQTERTVVAADFGDSMRLSEVIASMGELVVADINTVDSVSRTTPQTLRLLKSNTADCMDDIVVRLPERARRSVAMSENSENSFDDCNSQSEHNSERHMAHPRANFAKYAPLPTLTKLEYYPVALALYSAVHIVRQTLKYANSLPASGDAPLSQVVQYVQVHYPGREYQYKTYGFGKVTSLLAELPELFRVSPGPDSLPQIMWVHDAPRRLAWLQQEYRRKRPPVPSGAASAPPTQAVGDARPATATPMLSPSQQRERMAQAKKLLVRSVEALARESPTGGVEGFLPSLVVARAGQLSGTAFECKNYGYPRLKPLMMSFPESIEWFQKGPVDYVRLAKHQGKSSSTSRAGHSSVPASSGAIAAPNVLPVSSVRRTTYREALDPPPPYGGPVATAPLGAGRPRSARQPAVGTTQARDVRASTEAAHKVLALVTDHDLLPRTSRGDAGLRTESKVPSLRGAAKTTAEAVTTTTTRATPPPATRATFTKTHKKTPPPQKVKSATEAATAAAAVRTATPGAALHTARPAFTEADETTPECESPLPAEAAVPVVAPVLATLYAADEQAPVVDLYRTCTAIPYDRSKIKFDVALYRLLEAASRRPARASAAARYHGWRSDAEWLAAVKGVEPSFSPARLGFASMRALLEAVPCVLSKSPEDGDPSGAYFPFSAGQVPGRVRAFMAPSSPWDAPVPNLPAEPCFRFVSGARGVATDELLMHLLLSWMQLSTEPAVRALCALPAAPKTDICETDPSVRDVDQHVLFEDLAAVVKCWADGRALDVLSIAKDLSTEVPVVDTAVSQASSHRLWKAFTQACALTATFSPADPATAAAATLAARLETHGTVASADRRALCHLLALAPYVDVIGSEEGDGGLPARAVPPASSTARMVVLRRRAVAAAAAQSGWLRDVLWMAYATAWSGTTCANPHDWCAPPQTDKTGKTGAKSKDHASSATLQSETVPVLTTLAAGVPLSVLVLLEEGCLELRDSADRPSFYLPLYTDLPRKYGLVRGDIAGLYRLCFGAEAVTVQCGDAPADQRLFLRRDAALRWPRGCLTEGLPPHKAPAPSTEAPGLTYTPELAESVELMMLMGVALIMTSQAHLAEERPMCRACSDYGGIWFTATWVPLAELEACLALCYPFVAESGFYGCGSLAALVAELPYLDQMERAPHTTLNAAMPSQLARLATTTTRETPAVPHGRPHGRGGPRSPLPPALAPHVRWIYPSTMLPSLFMFWRHNLRRLGWSYAVRQDLYPVLDATRVDELPRLAALRAVLEKHTKSLDLFPINAQTVPECLSNLSAAPYMWPTVAGARGDLEAMNFWRRHSRERLCRPGPGQARHMPPFKYTEPYTVRALIAACDALRIALDVFDVHPERRGWLPVTAVEDVLLFVFPRFDVQDWFTGPVVSIAARLPQLFQTRDGMWINYRFNASLSWPAALSRYVPCERVTHAIRNGETITSHYTQIFPLLEDTDFPHQPGVVISDALKVKQHGITLVTKKLLNLVVLNYCLLHPEEVGIPLETLDAQLREWTRGALPKTSLRPDIEGHPNLLTQSIKTTTSRGPRTITYITVRNRKLCSQLFSDFTATKLYCTSEEDMYMWHSCYKKT